jgi:phosphoribosyl-ATP pyrophosphohydrolase
MTSDDALTRLMGVIAERKQLLPEDSYTTRLFQGGVEAIGAKVLEEARETVQAAGEPGEGGRGHLIREAADLLYHLLVLLAQRDATLAEVQAELGRREGTSGLAEKASRSAAASNDSPPRERN